MTSNQCLVGDIGGTNARFAVADLAGARAELRQPLSLVCAEFASPEEAIDLYFETTGLLRPSSAVIAIAGPVRGGEASTTNGAWRLSEERLRAVGFQNARLINDYTALAAACPVLVQDDVAGIGPDLERSPGENIAIVGAGTGFGVSALARCDGCSMTVVTEGGHVAFAPCNDLEIEILKVLTGRYGRVSVERILSGAGIGDLHWALARVHGRDETRLKAHHIVSRGLKGDAVCAETLERFCEVYGSVAGDFALAFGARGGVFLAGGIAPRMVSLLQSGGFRRRFEDKGRFSAYTAQIRSDVIVYPHAALIGAATLAPVTAKPPTPELVVR